MRHDWRFVPFLAIKDMLSDKKVLILVIGILALSYVNIVFFASFIAGLGNTFEDEVINTATSHIVIEPPSDEDDVKYLQFESSIRKRVNSIPGIVASAPRIRTSGSIFYEDADAAVPIIGIDPDEEVQVTWIHEEVLDGEFLSDNDREEILIGKDVAGFEEQGVNFVRTEGLDVEVGDIVTVVFGNGVQRDYHVKGIVGRPFGEVTRNAYITIDEMDDVLGLTDIATQIVVKTPDKDRVEEFRPRIEEQVIKSSEVKTWVEYLDVARVIQQSYSVVVYILSMVGILIAVITTSIVLYINITRKRRTIAMLKALGTKSGLIFKLFLLQAAVYGVLGILVGIGISQLVMWYLYHNPLQLAIGLVRPELTLARTIGSAVVLAVAIVLAGTLPAGRVAHEAILDNIRVK